MAELRLGHVNGASYLDLRLVYRDSPSELGYYQERRWTESPDEYLNRRLAQVLFEQRGIRRVVSGVATTLEAELTAFEEVRAPKRVARVQVVVRLQTQRFVAWEATLAAEEPLKPSGGDARLTWSTGLGARAARARRPYRRPGWKRACRRSGSAEVHDLRLSASALHFAVTEACLKLCSG